MNEAERFLQERKNSHETTEVQSPRKYQVRMKCLTCPKTFSAEVDTPKAVVACPYCGNEKPLIAQERAIKKPLSIQIVCVILYLTAISSILSVLGCCAQGNIIGVFIYMLVMWLFFAIPSGINKGATWARIVASIILVLTATGWIAGGIFGGISCGGGAGYFCALFGVGIGVGIFALFIAMFRPKCRDWFAVKKMINQAHEPEQPEQDAH